MTPTLGNFLRSGLLLAGRSSSSIPLQWRRGCRGFISKTRRRRVSVYRTRGPRRLFPGKSVGARMLVNGCVGFRSSWISTVGLRWHISIRFRNKLSAAGSMCLWLLVGMNVRLFGCMDWRKPMSMGFRLLVITGFRLLVITGFRLLVIMGFRLLVIMGFRLSKSTWI